VKLDDRHCWPDAECFTEVAHPRVSKLGITGFYVPNGNCRPTHIVGIAQDHVGSDAFVRTILYDPSAAETLFDSAQQKSAK
jgi:hypothetical protein